MNRRHAVALAMFALPSAVAIACSFPDVTFAPAGAEGGAQEGGGSEAASADAGADVPVVPVLSRPTDSGPLDANVCEARAKCDCDDDKYADENCDVDAASLGLKPGDCDDLDFMRHPDQDYVDDPPPDGGDGDWDCNGTIDKAYPKENTSCAGGLGLGCEGIYGFTQPVACGAKGDWIKCAKGALVSCEVGERKMQKQACK